MIIQLSLWILLTAAANVGAGQVEPKDPVFLERPKHGQLRNRGLDRVIKNINSRKHTLWVEGLWGTPLDYNLCMGIVEYPGLSTRTVQLRLPDSSIANVLDAVVAQNPGYSWNEANGVVHIQPSTASPGTFPLSELNAEVNDFHAVGVNIDQAIALLTLKMQRDGHAAVSYGTITSTAMIMQEARDARDNVDEMKIELHIDKPTSARDILDAIVTKDPPSTWFAIVSREILILWGHLGHTHRSYEEIASERSEIEAYQAQEAEFEPHDHGRFHRMPLGQIRGAFGKWTRLSEMGEHPEIAYSAIVGVEYYLGYDPVVRIGTEPATLPEFLDAVVADVSSYTWRVSDTGVINIRPSDPQAKVSRMLDRTIGAGFRSEGYDLQQTAEFLDAFLVRKGWEWPTIWSDARSSHAVVRPLIPKEERISIHVDRPTSLREILNQLVAKDPPAYWSAYMHEDSLHVDLRRIRKKRTKK